jgi:hypothetical protein
VHLGLWVRDSWPTMSDSRTVVWDSRTVMWDSRTVVWDSRTWGAVGGPGPGARPWGQRLVTATVISAVAPSGVATVPVAPSVEA